MALSLSDLRQKQAFLKVLIFSLVTVIIWVGFSIFRSQNKTAISPELLQLAVPLNPNINAETLNSIKAKKKFTQEEIAIFPIYRIVISATGEESIVSNLNTSRAEGSLNSLVTQPSPSPTPVSEALPLVLPSPTVFPESSPTDTQTSTSSADTPVTSPTTTP